MNRDKVLPIAIFFLMLFTIAMMLGDLAIASILLLSAVIVLILDRGN